MVRDIALTLLSRVSTILSLLLCTPFFYRVLGAEGYSLIAVSLIAHSLSGLVDAGLSPLAAAALARNADNSERRISALAEIYGQSLRRILPLLMVAIIAMSAYNVAWGGAAGMRICGIVILNTCMFADVFLLVFFRIKYACIQGLGRHVAANALYSSTLGLRAIFGVGAVLVFRDAESVFVAQALSSIVGIYCASRIMEYSLMTILRSFGRSWGTPRTILTHLDASLLQNLWVISFFASVTSIIPQVVVKFASTPVNLSRFSLAASLANALLAFQMAYQSVLLPQFARYVEGKGKLAGGDVSFHAMAGTFVIAILCGGAYIAAENLIAVWLGDFDAEHLRIVAELMRLQLVSVALLAATAVPYVMCIVNGRTGPQLRAGMFYFAMMLVGTPLAYRLGGAHGVAVAAMMATAIFSIVYTLAADVAAQRARWLRLWRWAILPLSVGAVPAAVASVLLMHVALPGSYADAFLNLIMQGGLYVLLSLAVAVPVYLWRRSGIETLGASPSEL